MRSINCSCLSLVLAQLALVLSLFALDLASSEESVSSVSADSLQNSRQKRSRLNPDLLDERISARDLLDSMNALKRAPGWGKRFSDMADDEFSLEDKRAPGWGKRSLEGLMEEKRAPGWGKRAPGWGKRAPGWGKRAPGWGKRAPGWGKRAPGWGKRSGLSDTCSSLTRDLEEVIAEAAKIQASKNAACGSDANDVQGK